MTFATRVATVLESRGPLLRGIRRRVVHGPFKTAEGQRRFLAAYDAGLKTWPVPVEELDVPTRFGTTHVITSGPKDAPPLVLLHGYMATSLMWAPNIGDLSQRCRVYAIDTMGQPSKSIPGEPIRSAGDYVTWLTETLDALHLERVDLMGMSFGGWLALNYAVAAPARVHKLALLSPGGFLPISRPFRLRGMLMVFVPARFTANSFMRWAGLRDVPGVIDTWRLIELMYLGIKHFRMPPDTLRVAAVPLSDSQLRALQMPVLLLMGDHEVLYDATTALARARRLIPNFDGALIPHCRHDMCATQFRIVDARVLDFLEHGDP